MQFVFFDNNSHTALLPLTYTRPAAELRVGILTIKEKWEHLLGVKCNGYLTQDYLCDKYKSPKMAGLYIASNLLPNEQIINEMSNLKEGEALINNGNVLVYKSEKIYSSLEKLTKSIQSSIFIEAQSKWTSINTPIDLYKKNGEQIRADIELLNPSRVSNFGNYNTFIGNDIFIDNSAKMNGVILNATTGPIFIDKNVEIMEGSVIRGPFAALENATIKMGSKIYGDTTVGPNCKIGGEVVNSIFYAYSNKGHDGFIGNSVIGEWCNLGADTNSSNLKNNYSPVSVWDYESESIKKTQEIFCGVIMGDHSKTGINTMLNTGTVIGVSANVFGGGFPPKFIPSYSWGGAEGFTTFNLDKSFQAAEKMMERRKCKLNTIDKTLLKHVFESDKKYR